eukprot:332493-Alexandrium_andersonii.AAC.1
MATVSVALAAPVAKHVGSVRVRAERSPGAGSVVRGWGVGSGWGLGLGHTWCRGWTSARVAASPHK